MVSKGMLCGFRPNAGAVRVSVDELYSSHVEEVAGVSQN